MSRTRAQVRWWSSTVALWTLGLAIAVTWRDIRMCVIVGNLLAGIAIGRMLWGARP